MHTPRLVRRTIAVVIAAVIVFFTVGTSQAFAATSTVTATGSMIPGSIVSVGSIFSAPKSGNYVVDTEIFNSKGARVAQFWDNAYIDGSITKTYDWNTSGLSVGTYRVAQGLFSANWSSNKMWSSQAGTFKLALAPTAPAATSSNSWNLSAGASGNDSVSLAAKFTAPADFTSQSTLFDTEIIDASGNKVAQWVENSNFAGGQTFSKTYEFNNARVGSYTVRQGAFTPDWSKNFVWNSKTASFSTAAAPASAPPTTPTTIGISTPIVGVGVGASASSGNSQNAAPPSSLYVDPANPAAQQAGQWRTSRPADAAYMDRLAAQPVGVWFGGWNSNIQGDVSNLVNTAARTGKAPLLVAYNIPGRDCGSYSAGGANGTDAYKGWIRSFAAGIGNNPAYVVLEPDALAQMDCLGTQGQADRLALLSDAVDVLGTHPGVRTYIDAGHPGWHSASDMASRLKSAGVAHARGFSLNVSNFDKTSDNVAFGEQVSNLVGGKGYVVDTSRNGNGSNGEWCNPMGRALGQTPTTNTGSAHADAFMWIKRPGESDGTCNGGPGAGNWWGDYALGLAKSAWG